MKFGIRPFEQEYQEFYNSEKSLLVNPQNSEDVNNNIMFCITRLQNLFETKNYMMMSNYYLMMQNKAIIDKLPNQRVADNFNRNRKIGIKALATYKLLKDLLDTSSIEDYFVLEATKPFREIFENTGLSQADYDVEATRKEDSDLIRRIT